MAVRSNIPQTNAAIRQAAAQGVARAGRYIVDLAQQLCPVKTGALKASIRLEPEAPALEMTVKAGGGGVGYAAHVEYGTVYSPAQPYMTPAARAVDVAKEVRAALKGK